MDPLSEPEFVGQFISKRLTATGIASRKIRLDRISRAADVGDSKIIYLSRGRSRLVVHISPRGFPGVVAEEFRKAADLRRVLGSLGAPILMPIDSGLICDCSYAVTLYRRPLSRRRIRGRLDDFRFKRRLFRWLIDVAHMGKAVADLNTYEHAIRRLEEVANSRAPIFELIQSSREYLLSGHFKAVTVPMHGDLWKGNVLGGGGVAAFSLIDWRGSLPRGFPLFDLMRAALSFRTSRGEMGEQVDLHRAALGCEIAAMPVYLLGALGHFAENLGEMPKTRFLDMAEECIVRLRDAIPMDR